MRKRGAPVTLVAAAAASLKREAETAERNEEARRAAEILICPGYTYVYRRPVRKHDDDDHAPSMEQETIICICMCAGAEDV